MGVIVPADGEHVAIVADEEGELDNLNRFMRRIGKQDERAMVLSLAAFIEDTLGRLLLAYLRNCKATRDLIEGFNAPLGTLSSRIKAVYAFGLATEEQFKDMEILRKIRNHFAHDWEGVSLQRNDIASMIGQLSGYTFDGKSPETGGRERLLATMTSCCVELHLFQARIEANKHVKAPDVSHRLSVVPPTTAGRMRYVE
ncbi:MltR family transcriptional regulator [Burkholderia vietnamiensis]|uniref:MltR family transcriptional regulator n=1 Tax=Burkholderia vietnamiensis TaxID=60552 RepID=UPI000841F276|nr:MltR family transcriptional regulator [Burkholderia vietnamiensis]AOK00718.1 hypothetical protein WK23_19950 [Burkholderia vietnamiensis]